MKNDKVDLLLKKALCSTEEPDQVLMQKITRKISSEESIMRKPIKIKRSFSALAAALALVLITTTAFAAWHFLHPSDIARRFNDNTLSAAFQSENAININTSVSSGGYKFTMLAVVAGKDLTDMPYYSEDVFPERTYAVVAVQRNDEAPMPDIQDEEYGKTPFFMSPLVKGIAPWKLNAAHLNGGYSETVVDGVMYRIVECDDVSMFADRGLYFSINTGTFFDKKAFVFDAQTGDIRANEAYDGSAVVFDLPLDKALADPAKAEQYLKALDAPDTSVDDTEIPNDFIGIDWDNAIVVSKTVKTLDVGEDGTLIFSFDFEHGSGTIVFEVDEVFEESNSEQSVIAHMMQSDDVPYAVRLTKDEKGIITGMIVMP
jgi:hypothetical protein